MQIRPLRQGKASILLKDLCVSTKRETVVDVEVTGIGKIEVITENKVPVDGERILTVSLLDHAGKSLPGEIIKLAQLSLKPMALDVLDVKPILQGDRVPAAAKIQYKILGKRVGWAEIVFTAEEGTILSDVKKIDVFPPLKLSPKKVMILPGNLVQVVANGGPSDSDIVFSTSPGEIKKILLKNNEVEGSVNYILLINFILIF